MSIKATDIAAWFVAREAMDHEKMQCLLYLSYAWYQALYHAPLFSTAGFEALPVLPAEMSIFAQYHHYGKKRIHYIRGCPLSEDLTAFLLSVYETYGFADSDVLTSYLRLSDPYQKARQRGDHFRIREEDMINYYEKQSSISNSRG